MSSSSRVSKNSNLWLASICQHTCGLCTSAHCGLRWVNRHHTALDKRPVGLLHTWNLVLQVLEVCKSCCRVFGMTKLTSPAALKFFHGSFMPPCHPTLHVSCFKKFSWWISVTIQSLHPNPAPYSKQSMLFYGIPSSFMVCMHKKKTNWWLKILSQTSLQYVILQPWQLILLICHKLLLRTRIIHILQIQKKKEKKRE